MNLRTRVCSPVTVGFPDCDSIAPQNRKKQGFLARKRNTHSIPSFWKQKGDKSSGEMQPQKPLQPSSLPRGIQVPHYPSQHIHIRFSAQPRGHKYSFLVAQFKSPWGKARRSQSQLPGHGLRFSRLLLLGLSDPTSPGPSSSKKQKN